MVDLSELFGEGWCVTLTQLAPAQALERMGVRDVTDVDDGMQLATERLEADGMPIWANWDIHNREQNSEGRDKISYNQWYVEAFTDNEEYTTLNRAETPPRLMRCDSATYFN
ncbi:hypothetical protein ABZ476_19565 [Streptomyces albogriseolus]|uniref:hypothetical protein n=1 Tax=Streptomyces TaxID=1883 RepID=UPI00345F2F8B